MAECCDYTFCEGLVTIGYMRSLIPSEVGSCVSVSAGTTASTCCGNGLEGEYVPKYSELTDGTFAPLRTIDSNPSEDENGFTYTTPTLVTSSCCDDETLGDKALMKSQIGFECTLPTTCEHTNIQSPSYCDLSYSLTVNKEWTRHRYECDENTSGNIKHTTTLVSASNVISGSLDREITPNGDNSYTFNFTNATINSETTAQCGTPQTASTSFGNTLSSYTVGFSCEEISEVPWEVPCIGGDYPITIESSGHCADDIVLEIIGKIDGEEFINTTVSGGADSGYTIHFDENSDNKNGGTITITPIIGGETQESVEYPFTRETCTQNWSPNYDANDCSVHMVTNIKWNKTNEEEHSY